MQPRYTPSVAYPLLCRCADPAPTWSCSRVMLHSRPRAAFEFLCRGPCRPRGSRGLDRRCHGTAARASKPRRAGAELPADRRRDPWDDLDDPSGCCIDFTERHELDDRQQAQFQILFESSPIPMGVYDPETLAFLEVNTSAVANCGYSRTEYLGKTIADIRPSDDLGGFRSICTAIALRCAGQVRGDTGVPTARSFWWRSSGTAWRCRGGQWFWSRRSRSLSAWRRTPHAGSRRWRPPRR